MRHPIAIYRNEQDLLDKALPYVESALDRGDPIIAVLAKRTMELFEDALGASAAKLQMAEAMSWWPGSPQQAFRDYDRAIHAHLSTGASHCLVVGEPVWQRLPHARDWCRYESYSTLHFSELPFTSLCLADERLTPPPVLEAVLNTHPEVVGDEDNPLYVDPRTYVSRLDRVTWRTPPPDADWIDTSTADPGRARRRLVESVSLAHAPPARLDDLALVVNEVLAWLDRQEAVDVRIGSWGEPGVLVCEIEHAVLGLEDVFVGYGPPDSGDWSNWGMWLARATADRLLVDPDRPGRVQVQIGL